jgi:signal transduction histidine kinase
MTATAFDSSLIDVIRDLSLARELGDVMQVTRQAARRYTKADGVTFVLRENDQCYYADEDAIAPLWKGQRFPLDACISGWVMQHGHAVAIADIYSDARIPHDAYRPTFVKSLAMVPVRPEAPIAAIGAYWATQHEATSDELNVLQQLANATMLALDNVRLYQDLASALARERLARQEAETANGLKDEFLSVLSHELRTPLNVIQGYVWLLKQPGLSPESARQAIETMERNTELQARLVQDLVDVSRGLAGRLQLSLTPVDLSALCCGVVDSMRPSTNQQQIALNLHVPDEPIVLVADPARLRQIIGNVLANALKFTPAGGRVDVEISRDGTANAMIQVTDTGIGADPTLLPHLFDRFRQADSSHTRQSGGLGLGLTLVKQLVELHGGRVHAHSEGIGRGFRVAVELPRGGPPSEARTRSVAS